MNRSSTIRHIACGLALAVFIQSVAAGPQLDATLAHAVLVSVPETHVQQIELEFVLRGEVVVSSVQIHYRTDDTKIYAAREMVRNPGLNYVCRLPFSKRLEYYLEVTPERGEKLAIRSAVSPGLV